MKHTAQTKCSEGSIGWILFRLSEVVGCVFVHVEGFGNATRIDYGTGHEMKFAAFLCCLMKMRAIPENCAAALVLHVISR